MAGAEAASHEGLSWQKVLEAGVFIVAVLVGLDLLSDGQFNGH